MAYTTHAVICDAGEGLAYAIIMCILFAFSRSGIDFNSKQSAVTDHSQSTKDIDPYFKSQLYDEDPGHRKPYLFYRMDRINSESMRTTEINFCCGWDSNPQPLDQLASIILLSYHRSVCSNVCLFVRLNVFL